VSGLDGGRAAVNFAGLADEDVAGTNGTAAPVYRLVSSPQEGRWGRRSLGLSPVVDIDGSLVDMTIGTLLHAA
jgi:hypothetical protein